MRNRADPHCKRFEFAHGEKSSRVPQQDAVWFMQLRLTEKMETEN